MKNDELTIQSGAHKILVLSDTHLNNSFEPKKARLLLNLIEACDLVVINGDFWDSWFCTFEEFINSEWKILFPKLLEKNTIYIYGNHDSPVKCDYRTNLFSKETANSCVIKTQNINLRIEHGHRLTAGKRSWFIELYSTILNKVPTSMERTIYNLLHHVEATGVYLFGTKVFHKNDIGKNNNKVIKLMEHKDFLITGDTHFPELDIEAKYGNTGAIIYGFASYITIENGAPKLTETNYTTNGATK